MSARPLRPCLGAAAATPAPRSAVVVVVVVAMVVVFWCCGRPVERSGGRRELRAACGAVPVGLAEDGEADGADVADVDRALVAEA